MAEKQEEELPWPERAKNMPISSGNYVVIANGFRYLLRFIDIESERHHQEVKKKDMQNKDTIKYWYFPELVGIQQPQELTPIREALELENKKKYDKVIDHLKNLQQEYTLELPKTAAKALGEFIIDTKLKNGVLFSMERTGTSGSTKYIFKKVAKEE